MALLEDIYAKILAEDSYCSTVAGGGGIFHRSFNISTLRRIFSNLEGHNLINVWLAGDSLERSVLQDDEKVYYRMLLALFGFTLNIRITCDHAHATRSVSMVSCDWEQRQCENDAMCCLKKRFELFRTLSIGTKQLSFDVDYSLEFVDEERLHEGLPLIEIFPINKEGLYVFLKDRSHLGVGQIGRSGVCMLAAVSSSHKLWCFVVRWNTSFITNAGHFIVGGDDNGSLFSWRICVSQETTDWSIEPCCTQRMMGRCAVVRCLAIGPNGIVVAGYRDNSVVKFYLDDVSGSLNLIKQYSTHHTMGVHDMLVFQSHMYSHYLFVSCGYDGRLIFYPHEDGMLPTTLFSASSSLYSMLELCWPYDATNHASVPSRDGYLLVSEVGGKVERIRFEDGRYTRMPSLDAGNVLNHLMKGYCGYSVIFKRPTLYVLLGNLAGALRKMDVVENSLCVGKDFSASMLDMQLTNNFIFTLHDDLVLRILCKETLSDVYHFSQHTHNPVAFLACDTCVTWFDMDRTDRIVVTTARWVANV